MVDGRMPFECEEHDSTWAPRRRGQQERTAAVARCRMVRESGAGKCEPESGRHDVSVRRAVDARARYFCRSC